jgi:hypothetical protein
MAKILPRGDAARLEVVHEIPERGPQHVMREARKPGDVDAELQMLVQRKVAWQLSLHERERTFYSRTRGLDFLNRVRRLKLNPVDASTLFV